jgi:multiple sugar transport system substrate-binding protein
MAGDRGWQVPLIWGAIGTILGVVVVLASTSIAAVVTDPDALEPGEIVVLSGRDDSVGGERQVLVNEWNALHPQSPARIVELSELADAQRSEMLAGAQAGGGDIDVYNLDVTWTAEFADAGYIRRLDDSRIRPDTFLPGPLATCYYRGSLWALPFNTDVGLLYYRSDLVPEPPTTWDQLADMVEKARADAGSSADDYVGQFADYEGLTVNALEAIRGAGGSVVDADGAVVLDDQKAAVTTGLEHLREIAPPGVPPLDETTSVEQFRSGHALFMRNWPVANRAVTQQTGEGPPIGVGVAPLPGGSGVLGGQNLAVSARSDQPRAAQALIEFLTGERSQQILFERGGLAATRKVVYSDQTDRDLYPYVATLEEAIKNAVPRPVQPHYARFSEVFRDAVGRYLRESPQEAVLPADLQDQLTAALQGRLAPADSG